MKLLLTSCGINNSSIRKALIDLLGKPIEDANALFIPTAIYPFPNSAHMVMRALNGTAQSPLCQLGWKSLGLLELTALAGIDRTIWLPSVEETDALLVWGGDPVYLSYWMQQSGLAELLPSLLKKIVYVGVSAGSMAVSTIIGETYSNPPANISKPSTTATISFSTPLGDVNKTFVSTPGAGLVDFSIIAHLNNEQHADASLANAEKWAAVIPAPVYAIDDQTAIKVNDGGIELISEGFWKLFEPVSNS